MAVKTSTNILFKCDQCGAEYAMLNTNRNTKEIAKAMPGWLLLPFHDKYLCPACVPSEPTARLAIFAI